MRFTSSVQTSSQVSLPFLLTHGKRRRYYHLVTRQEDVGGARCQDPTNSDAASRLVATLERTWTAIQHHHPDLPDVVIITGAGAGRVPGRLVLGHFAAHCWQVGDDDRHELLVGGEGLRRGARDVLATMLHEAGHGLAAARNLKDTSRQGRYHNAKYKALAEELGIEVTHHPIMGYSTTTLPDRTAELYSAELAALERRSPCTVAWSGSSTRTTTAALRTSRSRRHPTILTSPTSAARPSTSAAARSLAGSG